MSPSSKRQKKNLSKNVTGASCIAVVTIVFLYYALKLPFGSPAEPGPGFLPVIASAAVLLLCGVNILRELLSSSAAAPQEEVDMYDEDNNLVTEGVNLARPLIIMGVLIVFYFAVKYLGLLLSTGLLTFVTLLLFRYKKWWNSVLAAAVITALTWLIFQRLLKIRFPTGLWFRWF